MPQDWERIRTARPDITDWVIHWTQPDVEGKLSAFERLKRILSDGFLKPSFAMRTSKVTGKTSPTIRGDFPAVCFTDQPLSAFIQTYKTLPGRYHPYAVAINKRHLYQFGARPVIYGDESQLNRLDDREKYLWVNYNPQPNSDFGFYPLDWTHEREWRTRADNIFTMYWQEEDGLEPGVPLALRMFYTPPIQENLPRILVRTESEADQLRSWLDTLQPFAGEDYNLKSWSKHRTRAQIIPLEVVERKLVTNPKWGRIETMPAEELGS